jgi:septation ring formation regulator EzrA
MATSLLQDLPTETEAPDFKALEDKVLRTIELLTQAREARAEAQRDLDRVKSQLHAREDRLELLEKELISLRKDREHARDRIEGIITQIDNLVTAEAEV